jgi:tetratricopeptide (TPR) repeat protein
MPNMDEWTPMVEQVDGSQPQRMGFIRGLMAEGRNQEAMGELDQLLAETPDNVQALLALGLLCQREQRFEDAAACCERAMAIDPKNAAAPLLAAFVGVQGNSAEYAEANFHRALIANPRSLPALMGLARLHRRHKKLDAALQAIEEAARIDPESVQVLRLLATVLTQLGRLFEAKRHLDKALVIEPGNQATLMQLSNLCMELETPDEAVATLERALAANPGSRPVILALGRLKLQMSDWAGAEAVLRRGLTGEGAEIVARLALAEALIPQRKLREAREILSKVPRVGGFAGPVHRLYGEVYETEGKVEEAIASYRAALMHMTDSGSAMPSLEAGVPANDPQAAETLMRRYKDEIARQRAEQEKRQAERRDDGTGIAGSPFRRGAAAGWMGGFGRHDAMGQAFGPAQAASPAFAPPAEPSAPAPSEPELQEPLVLTRSQVVPPPQDPGPSTLDRSAMQPEPPAPPRPPMDSHRRGLLWGMLARRADERTPR